MVTVAIAGSGDIVIVDDGDPIEESGEGGDCSRKCWSFRLNPGDLYVLSGPSRNLCSHGVLAHSHDDDSGGQIGDYSVSSCCSYHNRMSLNFRFGIHSPQQALEEIDRHWR